MDLRAFAWIALKMFRKPNDGNTHAYAASITRYLEVKEFEDELLMEAREILSSPNTFIYFLPLSWYLTRQEREDEDWAESWGGRIMEDSFCLPALP